MWLTTCLISLNRVFTTFCCNMDQSTNKFMRSVHKNIRHWVLQVYAWTNISSDKVTFVVNFLNHFHFSFVILSAKYPPSFSIFYFCKIIMNGQHGKVSECKKNIQLAHDKYEIWSRNRLTTNPSVVHFNFCPQHTFYVQHKHRFDI